MRKMTPVSVAIAAVFLSGCAATQQAGERLENTQKVSEKQFNESYVKSSVAAVSQDDSNKNSNFGHSQRNWVNPMPLPRLEDKPVLPEVFSKNVSLTMPGTVSAVEILSEIQRALGVGFKISQDIYDTTPGQAKLIGAEASSTATVTKASPLTISDFVYRGTLEGALNLLAAKSNVSWKWNSREVELFRYETKTYNIAALAGATNTKANVDLKGDTSTAVSSSSGGGASSNSTTNNSSVSRQAVLTTWDEVKSFLLAQLSPTGSLAVLESTGAVTIRDIPVVHQNIGKAINDLNTLLSKQIYINVDVYAVTVSDNDSAGVDWNLVWSGTENKSGYISSAGQTASAGNKFSIGVLKGPFTGTNVVMSALSSVGKASVINQFTVTTLNGQPTPIAANEKYGYLASVEVTPGQDGQPPTYKLTPGEVSSGINMNVIPKIEPNGNILLEYAMNLSEIKEIRQLVAPNNSTIELPSSNLKSVLQRASLRSGQTLVLSGFKQNAAKFNKSGVGSSSNTFLGGKHDAGVSNQYLVITVTPFIANSNAYASK